MKFLELTLETSNLEAMTTFYETAMGATIVETAANHTVLILLKTKLSLVRVQSGTPFYHFAFSVKKEDYSTSLERIQFTTPLLSYEGTFVFQSRQWSGEQVYFHDPDGNIVELLWSSDDRVGLREVGLPSPDPELLSLFLEPCGNLYDSESPTFRFYGDGNGVFVLVRTPRPWFPLERAAEIHPVQVVLEGSTDAIYQHPLLPYTIEIKAPI